MYNMFIFLGKREFNPYQGPCCFLFLIGMTPCYDHYIGPHLALGELGIQYKAFVFEWDLVRDCHWSQFDDKRMIIRIAHQVIGVRIPAENRPWVEETLARFGKWNSKTSEKV